MRSTSGFFGIGTVLLIVAAAPAAAQVAATPTADELHAQALLLQEDQGKLVPAARLYQREAAVRGEADPRAVQCLTVAAHLLYYGDRPAEAGKVMEQAARLAMEQGDVVTAARTYLLAAWLHGAKGDLAAAGRSAHRAEVLAGSPLLAQVDRDAILARVSVVAASTWR
jgi:hypothetical protein